jgi:hypothetical protein
MHNLITQDNNENNDKNHEENEEMDDELPDLINRVDDKSDSKDEDDYDENNTTITSQPNGNTEVMYEPEITEANTIPQTDINIHHNLRPRTSDEYTSLANVETKRPQDEFNNRYAEELSFKKQVLG